MTSYTAFTCSKENQGMPKITNKGEPNPLTGKMVSAIVELSKPEKPNELLLKKMILGTNTDTTNNQKHPQNRLP